MLMWLLCLHPFHNLILTNSKNKKTKQTKTKKQKKISHCFDILMNVKTKMDLPTVDVYRHGDNQASYR